MSKILNLTSYVCEQLFHTHIYIYIYGVGVSRYPIGPYPDSASTFPFEVQRVQGINDVLERILELTNDMFEKFSEVRGEILHWV